jgi:sugar/nucleoside kinase (ribokinase family)
MYQGLFVGLATLDLIYRVKHPPGANEKIVALDHASAAGGPATNAAVTFSTLGDQAKLLSVVGMHPVSTLIREDLTYHTVEILDLAPLSTEPPPTSSVLVTQATGDRAVVSLNASKTQARPESLSAPLFEDIQIILIDGHQMAVSQVAAQIAKASQIPIVIDGGSWKPGFEDLLPLADYVICSENFYPPGCQSTADVLNYLKALDIKAIAITHGSQPIEFSLRGIRGFVNVPSVDIVDTLGAGDIFHGAFCHFILRMGFVEALEQAADVAAQSCRFFGTRQWIKSRTPELLQRELVKN